MHLATAEEMSRIRDENSAFGIIIQTSNLATGRQEGRKEVFFLL